jgi:hypothetical protein
MRSIILSLSLLAALPAAAGVPCFQLKSGEYQCVGKVGDPKGSLVVQVNSQKGKPPSAFVEGFAGTGKRLACTTDAKKLVEVLGDALARRARVVVKFDASGERCLSARVIDGPGRALARATPTESAKE